MCFQESRTKREIVRKESRTEKRNLLVSFSINAQIQFLYMQILHVRVSLLPVVVLWKTQMCGAEVPPEGT